MSLSVLVPVSGTRMTIHYFFLMEIPCSLIQVVLLVSLQN